MAGVLRVCFDAAAVLLVFHRDVAEEDILHAALTDGADRAAVTLLKSAVLNEDVPRAALHVWLYSNAVVAVVDVDIVNVDLTGAATWIYPVSIVWLLQRAGAGIEVPIARNVHVRYLSPLHSIQRHLRKRVQSLCNRQYTVLFIV